MNESDEMEIADSIEMGYIELLRESHYHCAYCNCPMSGDIQALAHIRGSKHLKKLRQAEQNQGQRSQTKKWCQGIGNNNQLQSKETRFDPPPNDEYFCKVCQVQLNAKFQYEEHMKGKNHAKKVKNSIAGDGKNGSISSKANNRAQTPKEQKFWFEPGFF